MYAMMTGKGMFHLLEEEEMETLFRSASKTNNFIKKALKNVCETEKKFFQWILQPEESRPSAAKILENIYFSDV